MIVADVSLIVYLFVEGPHTADAVRALQRDPRWVAPILWRSEFRNVLATMNRVTGLALSDALEIAVTAESMMAGNECAVRSASVLALAAESGCSAYDCEYVALAKELCVPLVTGDKQILKAFRDTAVSIEGFARA